MTPITVSTMQQEIQEAICKAWEAAWDRGEVDRLDDIMAPDYRRSSTSSDTSMTMDGLKDEIRSVRAAFPDLTTTIDEFIANDCKAVIFWTSRGTHTGDSLDAPSTNLPVVTRGSNILEIESDLVTHETVTWDRAGLLADTGIKQLSAAHEPSHSEIVVDTMAEDPDHEAVKGFNRKFITGVTVVTTGSGDMAKGLACNAYCSISFEPPLVLVCVQKTSSTHPDLFKSSHLGINIIANDQSETLATFASKGVDKFAGVTWHEGPHGSPLIDGSSAALEAEIKERFQAKTHTMFICRVRHAEVTDSEPMVYKAGRFYDGADLHAL